MKRALFLLSLLSLSSLCAFALAADEPPAPPAPAPVQVAPLTAPPALDALLDKIEEARQKVKTIKASVTYQKKAEVLDVSEEFSGSFIFEMPRLLRMELKEKGEEGRELNYIFGTKFGYIVHPDKHIAEQYVVGDLNQTGPEKSAVNPFEYGLTHGIKELTKTFDMKIVGEETIDKEPATILELTPKQSEEETARRPEEKLVFWIDKKTSFPIRVSNLTSRGLKVETFTLTNVEINARVRPLLGADPFEYTPPADYEVIPPPKPAGE